MLPHLGYNVCPKHKGQSITQNQLMGHVIMAMYSNQPHLD